MLVLFCDNGCELGVSSSASDERVGLGDRNCVLLGWWGGVWRCGQFCDGAHRERRRLVSYGGMLAIPLTGIAQVEGW